LLLLNISAAVLPEKVCLVPEKRAELTTEGGLDVIAQFDKISAACQRLAKVGCEVALFIAADSFLS
jgi:pyridoxine 5-phosphate synthase